MTTRRFLHRALCVGLIFIFSPVRPLLADAERAARLNAELDKALLVQKSEHNLTDAERRIRSVLGADDVPAVTQERAMLLLGKCLRAQGREAEGNAALAAAARGNSRFAQEAQAVLSGEEAARRRLERQVNGLVLAVKESASAPEHGFLVDLGDPAVPFIVRAMDAEQDHTAVRRLAVVLLRIGSRQVHDYIDRVVRSKDAFSRRVLLTALKEIKPEERAVVGRGFVPLIDSAVSKERRELVTLLFDVLTADELVAYFNVDDEELRRDVVVAIHQRGAFRDERVMAAVLPTLENFLTSGASKEQDIALAFILDERCAETPSGRRLFLDAAVRGILKDQMFDEPLSKRLHSLGVLPRVPAVERAVPAAELGDALRRSATSVTANTIRLKGIVMASIPTWQPDAVPAALELPQLVGDSEQIVPWLLHNADDDHVTAIARCLGSFQGSLGAAVHWLEERPMNAEAIVAIDQWLRQPEFRSALRGAFATRVMESGRMTRRGRPAADALLSMLGARDTPEARDVLVREAARDDGIGSVFHAISPVAPDEFLLRLLGAFHDNHARDRGRVLEILVARGVFSLHDFAAAFAKDVYFDKKFCSALFDGYSADQYVEFVNTILNTGDETALASFRECVQFTLRAREPNLPETVARTLFARALQPGLDAYRIVESLLRAPLHFSDPSELKRLRRNLYRRALASGEEEIMEAALSSYALHPEDRTLVETHLEHPSERIVKRSLYSLRNLGDKASLPAVAACLKHRDHNVRELAVQVLYRVGGDDVIPQLESLARDPEPSVRGAVYAVLGHSTSERAADILLAGLRDLDVHKTAAESLQRIEAYFEHRRRWDSWKESLSLEGESAAAALLKQARSGRSTKIRRAAIESLGTLAEPETLPLLIELMEDSDTSIAAAAEAAVTRINRAAKKRSDAEGVKP